jgi:hypothetical protein
MKQVQLRCYKYMSNYVMINHFPQFIILARVSNATNQSIPALLGIFFYVGGILQKSGLVNTLFFQLEVRDVPLMLGHMSSFRQSRNFMTYKCVSVYVFLFLLLS